MNIRSQHDHLVVNYGMFKINIHFNGYEEVRRARSGLLLLTSKFNLCLGREAVVGWVVKQGARSD